MLIHSYGTALCYTVHHSVHYTKGTRLSEEIYMTIICDSKTEKSHIQFIINMKVRLNFAEVF